MSSIMQDALAKGKVRSELREQLRDASMRRAHIMDMAGALFKPF